ALGIRRAPDTQDDLLAGDIAVRDRNPCDVAVLNSKTSHRALQTQIDPGAIQVAAQNGDHVLGGLIYREDAAVRPDIYVKPPRCQHLHHLFARELVERGPKETPFVGPKRLEDLLRCAVVGDVAFAATRDQDLRAHTGGLL